MASAVMRYTPRESARSSASSGESRRWTDLGGNGAQTPAGTFRLCPTAGANERDTRRLNEALSEQEASPRTFSATPAPPARAVREYEPILNFHPILTVSKPGGPICSAAPLDRDPDAARHQLRRVRNPGARSRRPVGAVRGQPECPARGPREDPRV